jgi:hypothetical protein
MTRPTVDVALLAAALLMVIGALGIGTAVVGWWLTR